MALHLPKRTLTLDSGKAVTSLSVSTLRAALDDRNAASSGSKGQLCVRLLSCRAHERVLEASSLSVSALKEAIVAEGGSIAGLRSLAALLLVLSTLRAAEVYQPLPVPAVPEVVPVPNGPADPPDGGQPPAAELPAAALAGEPPPPWPSEIPPPPRRRWTTPVWPFFRILKTWPSGW